MNIEEGQRAAQRLVLWHWFFAIVFVAFVALSSVSLALIFRDINAFNGCDSVEDDQFQTCYDAAR